MQYTLTGKTLLFTDLHLGIHNSDPKYIKIAAIVVKEIIQAIKQHNVSNVIFCGDLFHSRKSLDINILNYAIKFINAISKHATVYLICGNHDMYYKNSLDVNSINIFKSYNNIFVIDTVTEFLLNGQKAIAIPYAGDNEIDLEAEKYDIGFGHLEISTKYLRESYERRHMKSNSITTDSLMNDINSDEFFADMSNSESDGNKLRSESDDAVGNLIQCVKKHGVIYSGHIHTRDEFVTNYREFVFIGVPSKQTFGEISGTNGYYILDEKTNKRTFYEITTTPRMHAIYISDVLKTGINKFDFSVVRGNIVKCIYDTVASKSDSADIMRRIIENQPFIEVLPEYNLSLQQRLINTVDDNKLEAIDNRNADTTPIIYIKNYIESLTDNTIFKDTSISKDELCKIIETYYNNIVNV